MAVPTSSNSDNRTSEKPQSKKSEKPISSNQPPLDSPSIRTEAMEVDNEAIIIQNPLKDLNPKTCHQCRQNTLKVMAYCKKQGPKKPCPIKVCCTCLLNRYGENAKDVGLLDNWHCPKCRGICNCSLCMKKRGQKPTGIMVNSARKSGYSSVSKMLEARGPDIVGLAEVAENAGTSTTKVLVAEDAGTSTTKKPASTKSKSKSGKNGGDKTMKQAAKNEGPKLDGINLEEINLNNTNETAINTENMDSSISKKVGKKRKRVAGKSKVDENIESAPGGEAPKLDTNNLENKKLKKIKGNAKSVSELKKSSQKTKTSEKPIKQEEIVPLPQGISLTSIEGIELCPEDVGPALQFLEFCKAFRKVLDIKKGQPEHILRELTSGSSRVLRGNRSTVLHFQIKLLSLIQKSSAEESPPSRPRGGKSFLLAVHKCISALPSKFVELPPDCFERDENDAYEQLDTSKKLMVLNFLCDELLNTTNLRTLIRRNTNITKYLKEEKPIVSTTKDKKQTKEIVQNDETTQEHDSPLSVKESGELVLPVADETKKTKGEAVEENLGVKDHKKEQKFSEIRRTIRTKPAYSDGKGHLFWQFRGYPYLLQELKSLESGSPEEKWVVYGYEQKQEIEQYISFPRKKKKVSRTVPKISSTGTVPEKNNMETSEASIEQGNLNDQASLAITTEKV